MLVRMTQESRVLKERKFLRELLIVFAPAGVLKQQGLTHRWPEEFSLRLVKFDKTQITETKNGHIQ